MWRSLFALAFAASTVAVTGRANASSDYPSVIEQKWGLKQLPVRGQGCMLCHHDDVGGVGTATQLFGVTVRRLGAQKANAPSLRTALDGVRTRMTNSDGDPVSDYVEIAVDGTNPNDPKSFVAPLPVTSAGGQGGESSAGDAGGAASEPVTQPSSEPLPTTELPPPYTHGCALGAARGAPHAWLTLLAVAVGLRWVRRRRQRVTACSTSSLRAGRSTL